LHEREGMDFPLWKEDLPISYHSCNNGKERNWVAMNIGTLVISKERMLECIHVKFLFSCMLI
jgi:hypothetical protein